MIQSMTGYGKSVAVAEGKKIYVEIKSLNSKALDISARVAPPYREKGMEIRAMISRALERGKVDFAIRVEKDGTQTATPINGVILDNYYRQIRQISDERHIPLSADWFATLLRLPDVMARTEAEELDEILSHHRVLVYPRPGYAVEAASPPSGVKLTDTRSSTSVPPKSAVSSHKAATPLTDWTMRSGRKSARRDTTGKHKAPGRQGQACPLSPPRFSRHATSLRRPSLTNADMPLFHYTNFTFNTGAMSFVFSSGNVTSRPSSPQVNFTFP